MQPSGTLFAVLFCLHDDDVDDYYGDGDGGEWLRFVAHFVCVVCMRASVFCMGDPLCLQCTRARTLGCVIKFHTIIMHFSSIFHAMLPTPHAHCCVYVIFCMRLVAVSVCRANARACNRLDRCCC